MKNQVTRLNRHQLSNIHNDAAADDDVFGDGCGSGGSDIVVIIIVVDDGVDVAAATDIRGNNCAYLWYKSAVVDIA